MTIFDIFPKYFASVFFVFFSLLFSGEAISEQFHIEPVQDDFLILGYANGSFEKTHNNGCFKINDVQLNLNDTAKRTPLIKGVRFGVSVPWQIESFDFISKSEIYQVDKKLEKNTPLELGDFQLCLGKPVKISESDYFLTMEVIFHLGEHEDHFTTYAHEKIKYNKLTTRPAVIPDTISLSAKAGTYDKKILASSADKTSVTATLRFTEFDRSSKWPPAIIVGLRQHLVREDSFQLQFVKDKASQSYLLSSYRIIRNGELSSEVHVDEFSIVNSLKVELVYNEGEVTLRINENDPITVQTHLNKVAPYVLVSSGSAEISVRP